MRFETRYLLALLVLVAFGLITACQKDVAEPPPPPLASPLSAWNGAITDLSPNDTIGWVFANVESLREHDSFGEFLDEMAPRADDALALAVADASQVFVAWTSYADASRLSVVRTRVSASELIESIRNNATVKGLVEAQGPHGLPLWVDDAGWALAAPAENLVFAGPRRDVEQAAVKLLDDSLSEDDILANAQGVTFSMAVSSEIRDALLQNLDNRMVERAFEPVQRVEGRITINGPLEMNGQVLLSSRGNPGLLATFIRMGWSRLAPEALSTWFQPEYAERVASGFEASAHDGPRNAVDIRFVLPEQDTRLWLDALVSADFDSLHDTSEPLGDDSQAAEEPASNPEHDDIEPDVGVTQNAAGVDNADHAAGPTPDREASPRSEPTERRTSPTRSPRSPARTESSESRTAAPVEEAPTTLPP